MEKRCNVVRDAAPVEGSCLLVMPVSEHKATLTVEHHVEIPANCCPVSKNPMAGSWLTLKYTPKTSTIEVYSLRDLLAKFVNGWRGNDLYGPERNMEGMCQLVAQMAADAVGVPVEYRAEINLDCGRITVGGEATP